MALQGEDEEDEDGNGVGVDGAAGEGEEKSHREEASENDHTDVLPLFPVRLGEVNFIAEEIFFDFVFEINGFIDHVAAEFARAKGDKVESGEGRGEEEVAHKLRLDGEAGGVRKTEGAVSAAEAK